jgi:hypothetical protein
MTTNFTNWAVVLKDKMVSAATGRYGDEVLTMKQRVQAMAIAAAFAAGVTYIAQATFVVARLLLTNQDEWESRGEDFWDRFFSTKTQFQVAQYWGVFGYMINTAIDIAMGTRHNRGILGTIVGPAYGSLVQDAERFIKLFSNNSPNTNTAEHNAVQAGYHIASMLMTLGLVSVLPTTSTPARTVGFMWSFFGTAPFAPRLAGDIVVGETNSDLKKRADAGDLGAKIELMIREREAALKKRKEKQP